jgi:hypothetical protein
MKKSLLTATAVGLSLGSMSVGFIVGYKIAERNLALRFEERLLKETEDIRVFYQHAASIKKPFSTPEEAAANLIKPGTTLAEKVVAASAQVERELVAYNKISKEYTPENEEDESDPIEAMFGPTPAPVQNVFTSIPHVIDQQVFIQNDSGWNQSTLTYYVLDGALADERDSQIEDIDGTVGAVNMERFGEGSSDERTVHIRNPKLQLEFEVIKHDSSFRREVLGMDEDTPPPRPSGR